MSSFDIVTSSYVEKPRERSWLEEALVSGLLWGSILVLLAAVGIVGMFSQRWVIVDLVDLGRVALAGGVFHAGVRLSNRLPASGMPHQLMASALCGVVVGLMVAALAIIIQSIGIRTIFIALSVPLGRYLIFDLPGLSGTLVLAASGACLAVLGVSFASLAPIMRRFLATIAISVFAVGLFSELLRNLLIGMPEARPIADFVFSHKGLLLRGALLVGGLALVGAAIRTLLARASFHRGSTSERRTVRQAATVLAIAAVLAMPLVAGNYIGQVFLLVALFALMGYGLNIELGYAGLLDLGFVAFFAVGAYTIALLTGDNDHALAQWTFWQALPVAIAISVATGVIFGVPVLNVRGDYLAVATLGLGEIVRIIVVSDMAKPVLGGSQGLLNIRRPEIGSWVINEPSELFYLACAGCMAVLYLSWRLRVSKAGQSWMAIRDDEDVARSLGIDPVKSKLLAYGIGAGFAGLAGAIFAVMLGAIYPESFQLLISINVLALLIIGGLGSLRGVILGAIILIGVPEALREFGEFRYLFYGLAIVLTMRALPRGLAPAVPEHSHVDLARFPVTEFAPSAKSPSAQAPTSTPLLELRGVTQRFGGVTAIQGVDLDVARGSIHSIIGPNGAGKTTLFNVIAGFARPSAGAVTLEGESMTGASAYHVALAGVGRTYQNIRLFKSMTVLENVLVGLHRNRRARWWGAALNTRGHRADDFEAKQRAMEILDYLGLRGAANEMARHLSYGNQRRLEIGRALASRPKLLLLDEPLAGMNASEAAEMAELILDIRARFSTTILLIEHHMRAVMRVSDRITVLDHGIKICEGLPEAVQADPRVIEAYLGVEAAVPAAKVSQ